MPSLANGSGIIGGCGPAPPNAPNSAERKSSAWADGVSRQRSQRDRRAQRQSTRTDLLIMLLPPQVGLNPQYSDEVERFIA